LSDRYITDRYLPDKAIDLIDEAAAKIKTEMSSLPTELDQVNRKIIHIKTELASLKNETDEKSIRRLKEVEKELEEAKILQEKQNKI
jgi:ATP-dependent Clp protease ATP-binding subunit ClpB